MDHAIVSSTTELHRLDAEYVLARHRHADRTAELARTVPTETAVARLRDLPLAMLAPLRSLVRGSLPRFDRASIDRVVADDPHLALAIVEGQAESLAEEARARLDRERRALSDLCRVAAPATRPTMFQAGHAYPLLDPGRYDDEWGEGYAYALIAHDAEPGVCVVHDAWIVNARGERHPGREVEVPVSIEDVNLSAGRAVDER